MDSTYGCVQDAAALETLLASLASAHVLSFDVETTSTDAMQAQLVGLGLAWDPGQAAYIPLAHADTTPLEWSEVRQRLHAAFADPDVRQGGAQRQVRPDRAAALWAGRDRDPDDTLIMAWLLDSASRSLGLKALAADLLGWQMTELTELIGTGANRSRWSRCRPHWRGPTAAPT